MKPLKNLTAWACLLTAAGLSTYASFLWGGEVLGLVIGAGWFLGFAALIMGG